MPRKPTNYNNTCIYKFVCKDLNITDCYVGHTTDFRKRKHTHKTSYEGHGHNGSLNLKIYETIKNNGGWDNWDMIEIEKYPCNDSNEAKSRERYWFETLNSTLNSRSPLDRIIDNSTRAKVWRDNKPKINCECGGIYEESNKNRHFRTDKHTKYLTSKIVGV